MVAGGGTRLGMLTSSTSGVDDKEGRRRGRRIGINTEKLNQNWNPDQDRDLSSGSDLSRYSSGSSSKYLLSSLALPCPRRLVRIDGPTQASGIMGGETHIIMGGGV